MAAISTVVSSISLLFKAMDVAPKLTKLLGMYQSNPSKEDSKLLVSFAKLVDERRVYHQPYNVEIFEASVSSLDYMRDRLLRTISEIENAGAQAVLGAMLDDHRAFIDKWRGRRTPGRFDGRWHPPGEQEDGTVLTRFYEDLGALRVRAQLWMSALNEIEPKAKVPRFTPATAEE
jgi:hypothetical protein